MLRFFHFAVEQCCLIRIINRSLLCRTKHPGQRPCQRHQEHDPHLVVILVGFILPENLRVEIRQGGKQAKRKGQSMIALRYRNLT